MTIEIIILMENGLVKEQFALKTTKKAEEVFDNLAIKLVGKKKYESISENEEYSIRLEEVNELIAYNNGTEIIWLSDVELK